MDYMSLMLERKSFLRPLFHFEHCEPRLFQSLPFEK